MLESGLPGSVRGVHSNRRPYCDPRPVCDIPKHPLDLKLAPDFGQPVNLT
jgi:hypothetical protein